jgi:hypothetical protein
MTHQNLSPLARHARSFAKFQDVVSTVAAYNTFVAIAEMGHQHCGAIDNCKGKLHVCSSGGRIFHQKWIEVNPLVNIAAAGLRRFFWQNIICHFRVPRKITVDNAKQFNCHIFEDFCHQMGVEAAFASVYHPQPNGAVEKANALIFTAIKKILENQPKGKWAKNCRDQYEATTLPSA